MKPFYGDIHNHCGISYGHGSLTDALANARERLDFVSVTGHAHWPDMPEPDPRIQHIIDFHVEGFARLKSVWPEMLRELAETNAEGEFVIFPGFEVHSCAHGDRNILYRDIRDDLEILYPDSIPDLHRKLAELRAAGIDSLSQPHHTGYKRGTRGIDWSSHNPDFEPLVELISMHGCSESSDVPRPFLHVMGPSDWEGTIQYGLEQGHVFGVTGGTDHHSAHPGSYGHGLLGVSAENGTRSAIWDAFYQRRSWALTGDKIEVDFQIDEAPMGSVIPAGIGPRQIQFSVTGAAAIDSVEVLKNNRLLRRFSPEFSDEAPEFVRAAFHLELGWGPRNSTRQWEVELGISGGEILGFDPRFRGRQVVSPLEGDDAGESHHTGRVLERGDKSIRFAAISEATPNNFTNTSQGMWLEVSMPADGSIFADFGDQRIVWPLTDLIAGARSGLLGGIESHAWRMNRAVLPWEREIRGEFTDETPAADGDFYTVRVRQHNDQWAWSSAVFCRD